MKEQPKEEIPIILKLKATPTEMDKFYERLINYYIKRKNDNVNTEYTRMASNS